MLTEEQLIALKHFCDAIDDVGFGIHKELVRAEADRLLAVAHTGDGDPPRCGVHWEERWLKQHKEYTKVKAKPMETARKLAQQPEAIQAWFKKLKAKTDELDITWGNMYNMDETGCRIGVAGSSYVYTKHGKSVRTHSNLYMAIPKSCLTGFYSTLKQPRAYEPCSVLFS